MRPEADLCCYWFEKARAHLEAGRCRRVGLLATQGIRGGANRETLKRVLASGEIFFAESDRLWILEGAAVHVSMVGFDAGVEKAKTLDGHAVAVIHANLSASVDVAQAKRLRENRNLCFMGDTKGGAFDIDLETAMKMLEDVNPHGRPNSDVIVPWINGRDMTQRARHKFIIDFGVSRGQGSAARYERPFGYVVEHVKPDRDRNQREEYREQWWLHVRPRPKMRKRLVPGEASVVTPAVAKHRLFAFLSGPVLPDHAVFVFPAADLVFLVSSNPDYMDCGRYASARDSKRALATHPPPVSRRSLFPYTPRRAGSRSQPRPGS